MVSGADYTRFRSEGERGEDQLKSQTIGLVHLEDFRKRRAAALEGGGAEATSSRSPTPHLNVGAEGGRVKKRKGVKKGGLSFPGADDEDDTDGRLPLPTRRSTGSGTAAVSLLHRATSPSTEGDRERDVDALPVMRRLAANDGVAAPKAQTKSALLREAQRREALRREFLGMQERVRATEFMVPFVFYDGVDAPGGMCRMVKGDQVWRFLDKARKVGARADEGGAGKGMKTWARVSVDDLMLVSGDLILPHHHEFYYFMLNRTNGFDGRAIFAHSAQPTGATPDTLETPSEVVGGLSMPGDIEQSAKARPGQEVADADLEGSTDDPGRIKVVDRRWYEKNKHIFPQSIWQDFEPDKDYSSGVRKDAEGNTYFFGVAGARREPGAIDS